MESPIRVCKGIGAWWFSSVVAFSLILAWSAFGDDGGIGTEAQVQDGSPQITFAVGSTKMVFDPDLGFQIPSSSFEIMRKSEDDPGRFQVGLYYRTLPGELNTDDPDVPQTDDHMQGLSMALKFDQRCITCEGTYDLAGTITEAVGAEHVSVICENSPVSDPLAPGQLCSDDGDMGELIVSILVDALPPFDGKDLPPIDFFLKLVSVDFRLNSTDDSNCEECMDTVLHFPAPFETPDPFDGGDDGVDVVDDSCRETPLIRNLASVRVRVPDPLKPGEFLTRQQSVKPILQNGTVKIRSYLGVSQHFLRGDADRSGSLELSDAIRILNYQFVESLALFCPDAADLDDNGSLDVTDAIRSLNFQFLGIPGSEPRPPGPYQCGPDVTEDDLLPCEYPEVYCP